MDQTLDEIISKTKAERRPKKGPRRSAARAQVLGKTTTTPVQRARVAGAVTDPAKTVTQGSEKIIVSNLPGDVNEAQIKDLFAQTVGPLKEIHLHYDAHGRSKGVATVTFQKKGDGTKAFQQYNNRLIDGKRPMRIEIVVDPSKPLPLASRVAPASAPSTKATRPTVVAGRGRRVRGKGPRKSERPAKSAADLDAEMEDYTSANAPAATTA